MRIHSRNYKQQHNENCARNKNIRNLTNRPNGEKYIVYNFLTIPVEWKTQSKPIDLMSPCVLIQEFVTNRTYTLLDVYFCM